MAASAAPWSAGPGVARAPELPVLWAGALAGCAAAAVSVQLALASDHVAEPGLQAALLDWITLPYILAGLVAWWRRPDSRFGPLMVTAGFVMFLSSFQWANAPAPYTLGLAFDLLPVALFIHLFLAFPDGRLERRPGRAVVAAAYAAAIGLQVAKMLLGAGGPDNLLAVVTEPAAADVVQDVQLIAMAALALTGIALLAARRRRFGRPLRRSVSLLVDSFALGLAMIARAVAGAARSSCPAFETIRRVTFVVIGARAGRLPDRPDGRATRPLRRRRPVRRAAGRSAPSDSPRRPRTCPSRSVAGAGVLAARVRERASTSTAGRWSCPAPDSGRATTVIDVKGATSRLCFTTRRWTTSPSCSIRSARPRRSRSRTGACTPSSGLASRS